MGEHQAMSDSTHRVPMGEHQAMSDSTHRVPMGEHQAMSDSTHRVPMGEHQAIMVQHQKYILNSNISIAEAFSIGCTGISQFTLIRVLALLLSLHFSYTPSFSWRHRLVI